MLDALVLADQPRASDRPLLVADAAQGDIPAVELLTQCLEAFQRLPLPTSTLRRSASRPRSSTTSSRRLERPCPMAMRPRPCRHPRSRGAGMARRRRRRRRRTTWPTPNRTRRARPSPGRATCGSSASTGCSAATAPMRRRSPASWARTARRCSSPARPTGTSAPIPPAASRIGTR